MSYQSSFTRWLSDVLPCETPPGIVAFNFNIAETLENYVVEICGATLFDPTNSDWACDEGWTSRPSHFEMPIAEIGGWESALDLVVDMVGKFIEGASDNSAVLKSARAVAVGFVDGELVIVAEVAA